MWRHLANANEPELTYIIIRHNGQRHSFSPPVMRRSWSRVGDIGRWMCANWLKLNQDKTQFIWLSAPYQLSKLRLLTITLGGINIKIFTEAMCLGVLFDSALTFTPHVRRLSSKSFYHLRQMNTVRKSLMEDAATRPWYTRLLRVGWATVAVFSTVWVRPMSSLYRTCSTLQLESYCVSGSSTTSPLTFDIDYIDCPFSRELRSVCPGVQVSASSRTNIPHWSVLTGVWVSQSWSPPFRCTWWPRSAMLQNNEIQSKTFLLFLVWSCGTHSHCQFVTHHWHRLISVHFWRLCCSAEHMGH